MLVRLLVLAKSSFILLFKNIVDFICYWEPLVETCPLNGMICRQIIRTEEAEAWRVNAIEMNVAYRGKVFNVNNLFASSIVKGGIV